MRIGPYTKVLPEFFQKTLKQILQKFRIVVYVWNLYKLFFKNTYINWMEEPFFYQNASLLNFFAFFFLHTHEFQGSHYSIWETLVHSLYYKASFLWIISLWSQAETSVMETYMSEHKSEREHSHSQENTTNM